MDGNLQADDRQAIKGHRSEAAAKILLSLHVVLITIVLAFIIIVHFTTAFKGVNRKKVLPVLMGVNAGLLLLTFLATILFRPNMGQRRFLLFIIIFGIALVASLAGVMSVQRGVKPRGVLIDVMVVVAVAFSGILVLPFTIYNIADAPTFPVFYL